MGKNPKKEKKQKRIRPRRVPTDGDSESGQNSAREKTKKLVLGEFFGGKRLEKNLKNAGKSEKGEKKTKKN